MTRLSGYKVEQREQSSASGGACKLSLVRSVTVAKMTNSD